MENVIPENAGPPPHRQPWDEAYFVIAGEVEFEIGERRERVRAGEFVYAPGGTVHAFHGASKEPARMLIFDAPAHAESFFKDVDREVTGCATRFAKTACNWCSPWIAVHAAECLRFEALSSEGLTTLLPCVSGAGSVKPMCSIGAVAARMAGARETRTTDIRISR